MLGRGGAGGPTKALSPGLRVLSHGNSDGRDGDGEQQRDERELRVQPALLRVTRRGVLPGEQQRDAECKRERAADVRDREQPAFHHDEAFVRNRIARVDVVDEQARQVEQPGEPGDDEHDVERLEPEQHVGWRRGTSADDKANAVAVSRGGRS